MDFRDKNRRFRPGALLTAATLLLVLATTAFAQMTFPRGWVHISNGRVVTDIGTRLRGAHWLEGSPGSMTYITDNYWQILKNNGMNALRINPTIPLKSGWTYNASSEWVVWLDDVVSRAGQQGMYVLINPWKSPCGSYDMSLLTSFWTFVAPRYADKTNVIYELMNEPVAWSDPYPAAARQMENDIYKLIRSYAPNTHIMLWSYASTSSASGILSDIAAAPDVDYSNASVAFHGYASVAATEAAIRGVQAAGYAAVCTEFYVLYSGTYPNYPDVTVPLTGFFEDEGISWFYFNFINPNFDYYCLLTTGGYKPQIDGAGIKWTPDFGNWPLPAATAGVIAPSISPNGGGFIDEVTVSLSCATAGATIRYTTNGSTPTSSSTLYSAPFKLTATTTVKAIGIKSGLTTSAVATATFTKRSADTPYQVNCGGPVVSPFTADAAFNGGTAYTGTASVTTSGVTGAAPAAVYQSERYGEFSYTLTGLTAGAGYTVRLHFAEIYFTAAGSRIFNVSINGQQVLTDFDIFAAAGGANRAIVKDFRTTATTGGQIMIKFTTVADNAKCSGIEVLASSSIDHCTWKGPVVKGMVIFPNPLTKNGLYRLVKQDGWKVYSLSGIPAEPGHIQANGVYIIDKEERATGKITVIE